MSKKLLIDAGHAEETRVAVVDDGNLEEFDSENFSKKQIKSNVYLAKVVRIEPALQAAFVEYGDEKHGFLAFAEIHPDYYRIPVADRKALEKEEVLAESEDESSVTKKPSPKKNYRYKIQEVIQKRQILLVQVVRERRVNKGAALTTYISIAGRYCVLMPNSTNRSGGISRKIQDDTDRKRLKEVLSNLEIPDGMNLIVRTAGQERSKIEIRRDYDYLVKVWEDIREKTLKSIAPCLIHEEGDLVKRAVRDIYSREIDEILVEGEEAYKDAKDFMKLLMPSHAKKVKLYKDPQTPLFHKFKVEQHIEKMMFPKVELPSGGTIVINHTEALVAIDVNSGKSIKERNIEVTALKTNLEAAQEIGRQLRLRDLSGLLVIDFIDMDDHKYIQQVEQKLRESVKPDRARIQIGRISQFGLLELSRQRLRPSLVETHTSPCYHCHGTGIIRSTESLSLQILRSIEREAIKGKAAEIQAIAPKGTDLYLLNQKRREIMQMEDRFDISIYVTQEEITVAPFFRIDVLKQKETPTVIGDLAEKVTINEKRPTENSDTKLGSATDETKLVAEMLPKKSHKKRRRRKNNQPGEGQIETKIVAPDDAKNNIAPKAAEKNSRAEHNGAQQKDSSDKDKHDREPRTEVIAPQFGKKRRPYRNRKPKDSSQAEVVAGNEQGTTAKNAEKASGAKKKNWLRRLLD